MSDGIRAGPDDRSLCRHQDICAQRRPTFVDRHGRSTLEENDKKGAAPRMEAAPSLAGWQGGMQNVSRETIRTDKSYVGNGSLRDMDGESDLAVRFLAAAVGVHTSGLHHRKTALHRVEEEPHITDAVYRRGPA